MKGKLHESLICALDIGTTKICALVAQKQVDGSLSIIGIGKAPSHGLKKGIVVDINKTVQAIKQAIQEAELMAGCTIQGVYVGISGSHVHAFSSTGMVPIKQYEVTNLDIQQVIQAAQAIPIEKGQQILHTLAQYYTIDNGTRIENPLGMSGTRLSVQAHIITGSVTCVQNIINCCQKADLEVNDVILEQLASAYAVLSTDERMLGVGLIDIGGGTSDIAVYRNNSIIYTNVVPVAGYHFTNDLAVGLRITLENAEYIKQTYADVFPKVRNDEYIKANAIQGYEQKELPRQDIDAILQARARELLTIINTNLTSHELNSYLHAGLVLTGGGALLSNIDKLASVICDLPVRIGIPHAQHVVFESLTHPMYATGYGLLRYAHEKHQEQQHTFDKNIWHRVSGRMRSWMSEFF